MRLAVAAASFLLFTFQATGQAYVPFPTTSATWFDYIHAYGSGEPPNSIVNRHVLQGDTTINGLLYKKLVQEQTWDTVYIGALREDAGRNIWILPAGPDAIGFQNFTYTEPPEELLLYTFDQLTMGAGVPVNSTYSNFTIVDVDSIQVGDSYRRSYRLSCSHLLGAEDVWIEGIGSVHGLLSPLQYEFEWTLGLECFSHEALAWDNPVNSFEGCDIIMHAAQAQEKEPCLFPVPCSDQLVPLGFGAGHYIILCTSGQVLVEGDMDDDGLIPVSMIAPGVHVLHFTSADGQHHRTDRFLIQR